MSYLRDSMRGKTGLKRRTFAALAVGIVGVAAVGASIADGSLLLVRSSANPDPASEVLARVGSPRVTEMKMEGTTAIVIGEASASGGEATRTLWYETVAGAAYANATGATRLTRQALRRDGTVIEQAEDAVSLTGAVGLGPATISASDIARDVRPRADDIGVSVVSTSYIGLFGGTAEIVIRPDDETAFLTTSSQRIGFLLGDLALDGRPYLVTVLGSAGDVRLVIGYTPSVGGGTGQGIAWQAPDVHSNAIWGDVVTGPQIP